MTSGGVFTSAFRSCSRRWAQLRSGFCRTVTKKRCRQYTKRGPSSLGETPNWAALIGSSVKSSEPKARRPRRSSVGGQPDESREPTPESHLQSEIGRYRIGLRTSFQRRAHRPDRFGTPLRGLLTTG